MKVGWLLACLTYQQYASVSQGRICSDNFTCCHTEIEVADKTFYLTQSQYTDTGPISPSADRIMPGAWQGCHWSVNFEVTGMTRPGKIPSQAEFEPRIFLSRGGRLNHQASEAVRNGSKLSGGRFSGDGMSTTAGVAVLELTGLLQFVALQTFSVQKPPGHVDFAGIVCL